MKREEDFYKQLGARVAQCRSKHRRMTQATLAQLVSLTRTSINNIEKGRQRVPLYTFTAIAAALSTEPADLLPTARDDQDIGSLISRLPDNEQRFVRSGLASQASESG